MPRVRTVDTKNDEELQPMEVDTTGKAEERRKEDEVTVRLVEPKPRLVKVRFICDHEMTVGGERYDVKRGDTLLVEIHIANTLVSRNLAHML